MCTAQDLSRLVIFECLLKLFTLVLQGHNLPTCLFCLTIQHMFLYLKQLSFLQIAAAFAEYADIPSWCPATNWLDALPLIFARSPPIPVPADALLHSLMPPRLGQVTHILVQI